MAHAEPTSRARMLSSRVDVARGDSRNPLSWADLEAKFLDLVAPDLGEPRGRTLFERLRDFGPTGSLAAAWSLAAPG